MRRPGRLRVGQRFALVAGLLALVLGFGVLAGLRANLDLIHARRQVTDRVDPALTSALRLQNAFLDQETGVRGFVLAGDGRFLEPYRRGRAEQRAAAARVLALTAADPSLAGARTRLAGVQRLGRIWQAGFAEPAIAARRTRSRADDVNVGAGRVRFARIRAGLAALQRELAGARRAAGARLGASARALNRVLAVVAALLLLGGTAAMVFIRRGVTLPLARLADEVRRVSDGDFGRGVEATGPRDIVRLAEDVDSMRARIVQELTAMRAVQADLQRSNSELEQFAYVASHDLQEPLRKVASFTQMLQSRYAGQLDERADQYIFFAVDGAKRMQDLINDLLAFSRVGRVTRERRVVALQEVVDRALTDLSGAIEASGAVITVGGSLPAVSADAGLLALVFQNLVGNAIKFHGEDGTPDVHIDVTHDGVQCEIAIRDDGIGIEPEYADRIFVIFQRLHPKERYGGTGIGLAMCRKIVEHHGGRIWLDTGHGGPGTVFRFTLPLPAPGAAATTPRPRDEEDAIA